MIICSRDKATELIQDNNNLFRQDDRNKDIVDYEVKDIRHGRPVGNENLTEGMRQLIAEEAIISGKSTEEVAKMFGVSVPQVAALKHGATSTATYNQPNEALLPTVSAATAVVQENIKVVAQNKILEALNELTPDRIRTAKARDIAGIAKDMSTVVKNFNPETNSNIQNNQVLIYAPRVKEEDDYKVISARE